MSEPYINTIFSNQWERLADALADRLFARTGFFEKRYVIVPNEQVKEFLHFHLASRFGISAGVQMCSLQQGLAGLLESLSPYPKMRIPSILELSLCIEEQMHLCLESYENKRISFFAPLYAYLSCEKTEQLSQRIFSLSDQLAHVFIRYGLYGGAFVSEWLLKEGWQQWIWKRIFSQGIYAFDIQAKEIYCDHSSCVNFDSARRSKIEAKRSERGRPFPVGKADEEDRFGKVAASQNSHNLSGRSIAGIQVHLFGFSHVPPLYLAFFADLHAAFYLFSPCAQYWDDLCSDKERLLLERFLHSRKISPIICEEMERYLQDHHPLLSNWGKWGREFLKGLDAYLLNTDERYELSPPTLLGSVKNSMLTMQVPDSGGCFGIPPECSLKDQSIQIHSAPSKLREIEVLRDVVQTLLARHRSDPSPLQPKDILVLAPDIALYAPYIHGIFSNTPYAYRVQGLEQGSTSDFAQGFTHFLSLFDTEFSLSSVFKLFSFSPFRKRWGFSLEEVDLLHSWLKRAQVRIGEKSWQDGIDRLLWGLAMSPDALMVDRPFPLGCISQSDVEIFNQFLICYLALKKDLGSMRASEKKSLSEWLAWIQELAVRHFECDKDDEPLLCDLHAFGHQMAHSKNSCFSFASMQRILRHFYEKRNAAIHSEHLQHIRFCSMHHAAALPARIVYLLGMDEESFPRFEAPNSLCTLSGSAKKPYLPVKGDEDRYLFLELFCSARDYFIVSYERIHPKDNKPQGPCYLVDQVRTFVKNNFSSSLMEIDHPSLPFDAMYFTENSRVQNLNPSDFLLAQAHYSARSLQNQERDFFGRPDKAKSDSENLAFIPISSLRALAKHPIKFYFKEVLGMYVKEEESQEEDLFCLSPLKKHLLKRACLETDMQEVIARSDAQGILPEGLFKQAAIETLACEVEESKKAFELLHIEAGALFSVELSPYCRHPMRLKEGNWVLPALSIPVNGKELLLCGKLSDFTPEGYLVQGKKDLETLIAVWPLYLIYLQIKDTFGDLPPRIVFSKEGKQLEMPLDNVLVLLKDYIAYFVRSKNSLSPLMPKWASCLLLKKEADFEQIVYNALHKQTDFYNDPYLEWMQKARIACDPKEMFSLWASDLKRQFEPLLTRLAND